MSLYVEVRGLTPGEDGLVRYRVELRAAEGREEGRESAAVRWTEEAPAGEVTPVRVDVGELPVGSGVHRLIVTVADEVSGASSTLERVVKLR
jgi:hypothetical protein